MEGGYGVVTIGEPPEPDGPVVVEGPGNAFWARDKVLPVPVVPPE